MNDHNPDRRARTVEREHDIQRARVVRSLMLRPDGVEPRHCRS